MSLDLEQLKTTFDSNRQELVEVFRGAFGIEASFQDVVAGETSELLSADDFAAPGLLLTATGPTGTFAFVLQEGGGLLSEKYHSPDPTQQNIIRTLAQEIGYTLLPESMDATAFTALPVPDLGLALRTAGVENSASRFTYAAQVDDRTCRLDLVGPCPKMEYVLSAAPDESPSPVSNSEAAPTEAAPSDATPAETAESTPVERSNPPSGSGPPSTSRVPQRESLPSDVDSAMQHLPTYTKSLLRIGVPVTVKLASTKLAVKNVVEMSMGSIIQFDKSCEEPLTLEVAGHEVAFGEAVKVGDKFGLRITSVSLPPERFGPIQFMTEKRSD